MVVLVILKPQDSGARKRGSNCQEKNVQREERAKRRTREEKRVRREDVSNPSSSSIKKKDQVEIKWIAEKML